MEKRRKMGELKRALWIGSLEEPSEFQRKLRLGYGIVSAQLMQENLMKGLEETSGLVFDSISASIVSPFPAYPEAWIEETIWQHRAGASDVSVPFLNLTWGNRLFAGWSLLRAAKKWRDQGREEDPAVLYVYSMRSGPMAAGLWLKRHLRQAKLILIVTDLPGFMDPEAGRIKKLLKKMDFVWISRMLPAFDGYVLFSSRMAEALNLPDGKWIRMEGCYAENRVQRKAG